jgi:hypothetical protein
MCRCVIMAALVIGLGSGCSGWAFAIPDRDGRRRTWGPTTARPTHEPQVRLTCRRSSPAVWAIRSVERPPDPATGARLIETQSCGPRRREALTRARHARPDAGTAEPARARTPQTCDRRALAEYVQEGEKLEHVGERLAVLDDHGEPVVTVEITGVDVLPLARCPGNSWRRRARATGTWRSGARATATNGRPRAPPSRTTRKWCVFSLSWSGATD